MDLSSLKAFVSPRTNSKSNAKCIYLDEDKYMSKKLSPNKQKCIKSQSIKMLSIQKGAINNYIKQLQGSIKNECKKIDQKLKCVQQRVASASKQNIYPSNGAYKSCQNIKKIPVQSNYEKLLAEYSTKFTKKQNINPKIGLESTRSKNKSLKQIQENSKKENKISHHLHVNTQINEWVPNKKLENLLLQPQTAMNAISKNFQKQIHNPIKQIKTHQKKKSNIFFHQQKKINHKISKSKQLHIRIKDFQIIKKLGKGRFGNVYLAQEKKSKFIVALKTIKKSLLRQNDMISQLKQEIKIQLYLNHPNLLKMYGYFDDAQNVYLILEAAIEGNLFRQLRQEKKFSEKKAAICLKQIIESLIYLHNQGVIHRDIKPQNILINHGLLKLSDFGWSIYSPQQSRQTFCGTLDYVSPELVVGNNYDFSVDIWSVGVLCFQLITGHAPFQNKTGSQEQTYQKILKTEIMFPQFMSKSVKDFISKLLVKNPKKRMALQDALKHEWINENTKGAFSIKKDIFNSYSSVSNV